MSKEAFIEKSFKDASIDRIQQANEIMEQYAADGYDLTLRQLYYQFVARGMIENTQQSYKRLGDLISNARLAGLLDWDHLTDRTRNLYGPSHDSSPHMAVRTASWRYKENKWLNQPTRVEVWVEKEALRGVIGGAASRLDIDHFACKGYASSSSMYEAAKRLKRYIENDQQVIILYLGDHDPSGLDMDRDITERLQLMGSDLIEVRRIALTWEQVQHYQPPPNPAKITDSRAADYIERYGSESWELDALEPAVLESLIEDAVAEIRDDELFDEARDEESPTLGLKREVARRWDEVVDFLQGGA